MDNQIPTGLPGVSRSGTMPDDMAAMLLTQPEDYQRITEDDVARGAEILRRYQDGKRPLDQRITQDERWWQMRHWEQIRGDKQQAAPEPTSAWLFNTITSKHADLMDNFPVAALLPREESDQQTAKILSSVLPCIMEVVNYEQTYSDCCLDKVKHGTTAYGILWDRAAENGLGEIDITEIDIPKLFWEPDIEDIQDSKNLFIVEEVSTEDLDAMYPQYAHQWNTSVLGDFALQHYTTDDNAQGVMDDTKTVVVDWYYKATAPNGRNVLHYIKFAAGKLLYASENDPDYRDSGWYEDGLYPVVLDTLFQEKGTPAGFGLISVCKAPQLYIDKLDGNIQLNAMQATHRRWMVSLGANINKKQLLDWTDPLIEVTGEVSDARIKELTVSPLSPVYVDVRNQKIEEMKETSSNRDFNSGGSTGGITAASAIAALQEAGNKVSRDMISASYRAFRQVVAMVISRIRQFYTLERPFRITDPNAEDGYSFQSLSNAGMVDQQTGVDSQGIPTYRRPIFDIDIRAMRRSPFSRIERNELAKELYSAGFFSPERAQESLIALELMDFDGKDTVIRKIQEGKTLYDLVQQQADVIAKLTGTMAGAPAPGPDGPMPGPNAAAQAQNPVTRQGYNPAM